MPNRRVKQTYVHIGPRDIKKRKTTFFYLLENSDWNISSRLNYIPFFSFFFFLENWKREMRQPLMIDKPVIKLYKSLHHCYHWTVLDIFTNCRSTRCEKKQKRFENFFSLSLYATCQMRKTNCPLNNPRNNHVHRMYKKIYTKFPEKLRKNPKTIRRIEF